MLQFGNYVWLIWALWILLLPLKWILAAGAAACFHEACHIAAIFLSGGKLGRVTVSPFGVEIETVGICGLREFFCALAGPAGSFLLLILIHRFPTLALCGLVQGVYNLLPMYPLDGGRALVRLLECVIPNRAESLYDWIEKATLGMILFASIYISVRFSFGIFPVYFCLLTIINALLRKRP